jgi:hypothetical protein
LISPLSSLSTTKGMIFSPRSLECAGRAGCGNRVARSRPSTC